MGLLIARAASRIRALGADFTRDNLRRHYLEPLQESHYWQDVEFLRNWPGYVKRTRTFFGRDLDVDGKPDGTRCEALGQLVKQVIGILALGSLSGEVLDSRSRRNAVASVTRDAGRIGEAHRRHSEIGFLGEAGRTRLRCLHEGQRGRMLAKEGFDGRRRRL